MKLYNEMATGGRWSRRPPITRTKAALYREIPDDDDAVDADAHRCWSWARAAATTRAT